MTQMQNAVQVTGNAAAGAPDARSSADQRNGMRAGFLRRFLRAERPAFAALLALGLQGMVLLANLATGVITARTLGPEGRGVLAAVTLWPALLAGLSSLGLPLALIFFLRTAPQQRDVTITAALLISLLLSGIATLGGWAIVDASMRQYPQHVVMLAAICIGCTVFYGAASVMQQALSAIGRYRAGSLANSLPALLYLVLLLAAVATTTLTPSIVVACVMLPGILIVGWSTAALCRAGWRPKLRGLRAAGQALIRYAAKAAPTESSGYVLQYIDRLFLMPLVPAREIGLYAVAFSLSRLITVLDLAVSSVTFSAMTGRPRAETKALNDHLFRLTLYGVVVAMLIGFEFGGLLLSRVFGPEFKVAAVLLYVLLAEAGLQCVANNLARLYFSLGHPGFASVSQVVCLGSAALAMMLLVPGHGALGAAVALLLSTLLRLVVLLTGLRCRLGVDLPRPWPMPDDLRFLRGRLQ